MLGPDDDSDIIQVDLNFAAAAGHIEAWRRFRPRLMAAATAGFQISQKEAAAEFTRLSKVFAPVLPRELKMNYPLGYYGIELP